MVSRKMNSCFYSFLMMVNVITGCVLNPTNSEFCCKCDCWSDSRTVMANCCLRSLDVIPSCTAITNQTTIFLLNYNKITRIEEDSLARFWNLSKLELSNNNIYYIHQKAFRNLRNLKILYLRDNCLVYNRTVFEPNIFKHLTNVRELKLDDNNNDNTHVSPGYLDYALEKLSALNALQIDGLKMTFGKGFSNLGNLNRLCITGRRCNMSMITNRTFQFLPYLTEIFINNCSLFYIEPGSFRHQCNIYMLSLSDNNHLGFEGVTNATSGIHQTLEILCINRIVLWDALCVKIHIAFVQNLQNTSLRKLVANDNRIVAFDQKAIPLFPKTLKNVSMRGHNFQYNKYVGEIQSLTGLTALDLTGKDNKNIEYFQDPFHSMLQSMQWSTPFSYKGNKLQYETQIIYLPPNLQNLTFAYNQAYYYIGNISVKAKNLEIINVSRNLLTRWLGPVCGLESLKRLDLSHNFAYDVTTDFFQRFHNLEYLDLSYNLLGNVIKHMGDKNLFENLTKLRYLDLTENYVDHLPYALFSNLCTLEVLNLSQNRIHSLDIDMSKLNRLKVIRCQNNIIQWLDSNTRTQFDRMTEHRHISLDLSGNPIACTCDNLHFLSWIHLCNVTGKIVLGNLSNYYCYYSSGQRETLENIEKTYSNVELMCYDYVGFCIGMSCVVFVTLFVIIVGLLYRFRWKLRYLFYAARHRINNVTHSRETDHDYTYDAFLSFAEEDRDFVVNQLLDKLEGESDLELNFHQRNFKPGRPIAENIIEAIQTSKRTLIILTENFLKSYWCNYELQMANMESVTTGRDVLLIVMMEHIPTRKIPTQILYHIQTDSYLQYPSEGDTDMFWRNLTDSLKR